VTAVRSRPGGGGAFAITRPAPNAPRIDPATRGVAGAVVMLRDVGPAAARPWDHPPVTVEVHDERLMVRQGDGPPRAVGFVRRGDAVTIISRQPRFHALQARGAAFWSLTLPDPDRPRSRRLDQPGRVDLSSAAEDFWLHAHLFVDDHPYYALTAADGRWALTGVPPGAYELVAWLPPWRVARRERNPESGAVVRWVLGPGPEQGRRLTVTDEDQVVPDFTFKE
jgi:hypothetical protein